jgi:formate hydrogenlyase subunit 3/multisubunit Na+/H+ antiporter MnhD subunit
MPPALVLVPHALLAAAAVTCWGLRWARPRGAQVVAASAAWLAGGAIVTLWFIGGRQPIEFEVPQLTLAGVSFGMRLDAVSTAFGLLVLVPLGLLLAFQRRTSWQCALAVLAALAAVSAIESDRLLLTAVGFSACVTVLVAALRHEEERGLQAFLISLRLAWLLLLWAAVLLEVSGGTSNYAAVPVTALGPLLFMLLAVVAVLAAGVLPLGTWVPLVWGRPRLEAGSVAVSVLVPLGFLLLVRAYGLGGGRWPDFWLNLVLALLGAAASLGAALRAQAAVDLRGYLAQTVPMATGLALLSLSLGTPAGIDAAIVALAGAALLAGAVPLLPGAPRTLVFAGLGVAAGLPPTLVFGGWLLAIQAAFGAGAAFPLLGLAAAATWLLWVAGFARALRLPTSDPATGAGGAWVALAMAVLAGFAAAWVEALLALPAAGEVIRLPPALSAGTQLPVAQPSGGWSPLLLGLPFAVLVVLTSLAGRRLSHIRLEHDAAAPVPLPHLALPHFREGLGGRAGRWVRRGRSWGSLPGGWGGRVIVPLTRSQPWAWAAITLLLVLAVTR